MKAIKVHCGVFLSADGIRKKKDSDYKYDVWDAVLNIATGSIYGDIKDAQGGGDGTDIIENVLTGGLAGSAKCVGITQAFQSSAEKEADVWNRLDPTKKYPMPANATCQQLDVLTQQLQGELAWTDQQSAQEGQKAKAAAGNYKAKVQSYQNSVNALYTISNCKQQELQAQQAICQQNAINAATAAEAALKKQNAGSGFNEVTIGLAIAGVLFVGIIIIVIKGNKSNPIPTPASQ